MSICAACHCAGSVKTAEITVNSRVSSAEKGLVFSLKEPKTFLDAAEALGEKCSGSESDVCCDAAVTGYLEANTPETYLYGKMVAEFKRSPVETLQTHGVLTVSPILSPLCLSLPPPPSLFTSLQQRR